MNRTIAALLQLIGDVASAGSSCKDPEVSQKLFMAIADASANGVKVMNLPF